MLADGRQAVTTCALVVTNGHTPFLPHALHALDSSARRPERIVVADRSDPTDPRHLTPERLAELIRGVYLVETPQCSFAAAVATAMRTVSPDDDYLWLLHDDCAPAPDCLEELEAELDDDGVGIAGPKQCLWGDDTRLLSVGIHATTRGHRVETVVPGEPDQGQHDRRRSVSAVGTAGMLIRRRVWQELGGTDPRLGPYGEGWELSRRARAAGHDVVVATGAHLRHARAHAAGVRGLEHTVDIPARSDVESRTTRDPAPVFPDVANDEPYDHVERARRATRLDDGDPTMRLLGRSDPHTTLANRRHAHYYLWTLSVPFFLLPFVILLVGVVAPMRALVRVANKDKRAAWAEVWGSLLFLARLDDVVAQRHRTGRLSWAARRRLGALAASSFEVWRHRSLARKISREGRDDVEADDIARASLAAYRRRTRWACLLSGLLVACAVLAAGHTMWGGIGGGAYAGLPARLGDLWDAALSAWVPAGVGHPGPPRPLLVLLAILASPAAALGASPAVSADIAWICTPLLAWAASWWATSAWGHSPAWRGAAATAWAMMPGLWASWWSGAAGPVIVHLGVPIAVWASACLLGLDRLPHIAGSTGPIAVPSPRRRSCAWGVSALSLALVAAAQPLPALLVAGGTFTASVVIALRRRSVLVPIRALSAAVPAAILLTPTIAASQPWRQLWRSVGLGEVSPKRTDALDAVAGSDVSLAALWPHLHGFASYLPVLPIAAVAVLACIGIASRPRPLRWVMLAAAIGSWATLAFMPADPYASLHGPWALAVWLLIALGAQPGLVAPARQAVRRALCAGFLAASITAGVAGLVSLPTLGIHPDRRDARVTPALALAQTSSRKPRLLEIEPGEQLRVRIGRGSSPLLTDGVERPARGPGEADRHLAATVTDLVSAGEAEVAHELARQGISDVVVAAGRNADDLVEGIARTPGITRISEGHWRVEAASLTPPHVPARLVLKDRETATIIPSGMTRASSDLGAAPRERTIELAETYSPLWRASVDGQALSLLNDDGLVAWKVPAGVSGRLEISYGPRWWPLWQGGILLALAWAALRSLPFKRRELIA